MTITPKDSHILVNPCTEIDLGYSTSITEELLKIFGPLPQDVYYYIIREYSPFHYRVVLDPMCPPGHAYIISNLDIP